MRLSGEYDFEVHAYQMLSEPAVEGVTHLIED